jgi:hypothetical protein
MTRNSTGKSDESLENASPHLGELGPVQMPTQNRLWVSRVGDPQSDTKEVEKWIFL